MILDPPADPVAIISSPVSRSSAIELFPPRTNGLKSGQAIDKWYDTMQRT
jgi:hypothetical protein